MRAAWALTSSLGTTGAAVLVRSSAGVWTLVRGTAGSWYMEANPADGADSSSLAASATLLLTFSHSS